jgi:uncharacterized protein YjbI with pentapeptide repeats
MSDDQAPTGKPELGDAWGDDISEEREAELQVLFDRQREWAAQPEATRGESVFKGVKLTGADVGWLVGQSGVDKDFRVNHLHLEGANLREAHLEEASLTEAYLERANLSMAHLERADLTWAHGV